MTTTDIDDLKKAWNELGRQLDRQNALNLRQFKDNRLARFRSGLRPLVFGQTVQLILGAIIAVVSATFWANHLASSRLLICGLLLQAYGIMFIGFAVRDLILIRRIDYAAPVIVIQKQLAELRAWHLRVAFWHGITGSVIWLPAMLVLLHQLGVDVWINTQHKLWWLVSTVAGCLVANYALVFLARSPGKCGRMLAATWIGGSVRRAQATLDELEQFERELS